MVVLSFLQQCFLQFLVSFPLFHFLVKLIPNYFILSNAIVSGTVFLISFLNCPLLVYINKTDFCIDFVYSHYVNSCISSNRSFVNSLGFSVYYIMSSMNRDNFPFSFPMFLVPLSCLITSSRTFCTMWNRSDKVSILALILISEEKLLVFYQYVTY